MHKISSHGDPMASVSSTGSVSSIETKLNLILTDDGCITVSESTPLDISLMKQQTD